MLSVSGKVKLTYYLESYTSRYLMPLVMHNNWSLLSHSLQSAVDSAKTVLAKNVKNDTKTTNVFFDPIFD